MIILKATALLAIAAVVQGVMQRRASAAMRHLIYTLAVASVMLLPLFALLLPAWPVVIRTTPSADVAPAVIAADDVRQVPVAPPSGFISVEIPPAALQGSGPLPFSWSTALMAIYSAGVVAMLLYFLVQHGKVRRFARRAMIVQNAEWHQLLAECARSLGVERPVRLLQSREHNVPVVFGIRRASFVIPLIAETWTEDRRRAVVLHELAHVARHDCLTQALAYAACTIYWFHPGVWWAARRMRVEAEFACDDRVIAVGTEGSAYAGHLLEIAYSFGGGYRVPALAIGMARPRQLEGRMLAALDAARNRRVPAGRVRLAAAVATAVLMFALAAAAPMSVAANKVLDGVSAGASSEITVTEQDSLPGTWEIRPTKTEGTVHLRLVELNSSSGSNVPLSQFEGLTAAQLAGAGGPIQFRMRRDAGTFTFEGVIRSGVGAGTFSFAPNAAFPAELAKRGFARPSEREQYQMARHDIGYAFIDELTQQGYTKPATVDLVRAGQHGVNATYVREMGALGYRLGTLAPLVELRDHGVTPEYVRDLAGLGYKGLSADEIRRARDHGVSVEYVRAMRDAGYGAIPMDALINARDHGVSPEFVRGLAAAGHAKLPLQELIRVRDHGVSPEYVRDMRQLGHTLAISELVRARDHGVSVEFVREMTALGYGKATMENLIRVRDHGVGPEYVRELKALGYEGLSLEDLVMLRDHGMTADRIRAANARAGTRLPLDLLKSLARGGQL